MTLTFEIPGDPRGKGRPKFSTRGGFVRTYTDDKTASYENLVALAAQAAMAGRPPMQGAIRLSMVAILPIPASASKRRREDMLAGRVRPTKKPDMDNILKAVLDGCNQVAFVDDKQIVSLKDVDKFYGVTPGLSVTLTEIAGA